LEDLVLVALEDLVAQAAPISPSAPPATTLHLPAREERRRARVLEEDPAEAGRVVVVLAGADSGADVEVVGSGEEEAEPAAEDLQVAAAGAEAGAHLAVVRGDCSGSKPTDTDSHSTIRTTTRRSTPRHSPLETWGDQPLA